MDGEGDGADPIPVSLATSLPRPNSDGLLLGISEEQGLHCYPLPDKMILMYTIREKVEEIPLDIIQQSIRQGYVNRLRKCVLRGGRQVEPYAAEETVDEDSNEDE